MDETNRLDNKRKKREQQIIGGFLCYSRAVDTTIIKALNSLSFQQTKPMENADKCINQFLQHSTARLNAKMQHYASDMLLKVYSDASCMNEIKARSTASECFLLGRN